MAGEDLEKQTQQHQTQIDSDSLDSSIQRNAPTTDVRDDARVDAIRKNNTVLRFFSNLNTRLSALNAFEARGVERVPEDQRRPPQKLNVSDIAFFANQLLHDANNFFRWCSSGFHCFSVQL